MDLGPGQGPADLCVRRARHRARRQGRRAAPGVRRRRPAGHGHRAVRASRFPAAFESWARGDEEHLVPGAESTADVLRRMVPGAARVPGVPGRGGDRASSSRTAPRSRTRCSACSAGPSSRSRRCAAWTTARGRSSCEHPDAGPAAARDATTSGSPAPISHPRTALAKIPELPGQGRRGCGAAGSAPPWHGGGQGFESPQLHQIDRPVPDAGAGLRAAWGRSR